MASIRLETPEPFDFKNPDGWARWKSRFEQFRQASGLSKESEIRQVSTLLYCMGQDADNVLTSTNISDDDRKNYKTVMDKFEGFFQVRKNTIYERARFNRRDQREGESAEQYVTALYELVKNCEYGDLRDEMLRDRLVVGIKDKQLSEKLQMNADLTLEIAKKKIRQKEAVQEQHVHLHDGSRDNPIVVEGVHSNKPQGQSAGASQEISYKPQAGRTNPGYKPQPGRANQCTRCGGHKLPQSGAQQGELYVTDVTEEGITSLSASPKLSHPVQRANSVSIQRLWALWTQNMQRLGQLLFSSRGRKSTLSLTRVQR